MDQIHTCRQIDNLLPPTADPWTSSKDLNGVFNGDMDFTMVFSTSSGNVLTETRHIFHQIQDTNQSNGRGGLIRSQEVQNTPSAPTKNVIDDRNMDSMVEGPSCEQLLVHEQLSPSSHPNSAIYTQDRSCVVNAAVGPRQSVDWDLPIPSRPPKSEDWRIYRTTFTQLYKTENKTLREVMNIMKKKYHFQASPRMFKHRIKEWRLSKNYTAAKRLHLAQSTKDIKFTGSSQIALENLPKRLALSSMPVKPLVTPPSHRYTEIILLQTKIYCESYAKFSVHGVIDDNNIPSGIFCNKVDAALTSIERGQAKEGWHILHEASDSIRSLFKSNDKSILRLLLRFARRWYKSATPELFKILWTHISDMASTILSPNNPITLVCVSITHIGDEYEVCETAFGLMLSEFEQRLGHEHEKTLEIKELYQLLLLESEKFDAAELLQRQLLHHYEHINAYSHSSVWAAYGLGLVLEKKEDFQGAQDAYESALLRGNICNREQFPTQNDIYVLHHLVRMLSRRHEYDECEALLAQAMDTCLENNGGPTDCRAQQILEDIDEISLERENFKTAGIYRY